MKKTTNYIPVIIEAGSIVEKIFNYKSRSNEVNFETYKIENQTGIIRKMDLETIDNGKKFKIERKKTMKKTTNYIPMIIEVVSIVEKFLDYKSSTNEVNFKTYKIENQTGIIIRKIDSEETIILDKNQKSFNLDNNKVKVIGKSSNQSSSRLDLILNQKQNYIDILCDPNSPIEIKQMMPDLIKDSTYNYVQEEELSKKIIDKLDSFSLNINNFLPSINNLITRK